eukprot:Gb_30737 [translate_table: standard]
MEASQTTNASLLLLPISYDLPPSKLDSMEIDLATHKKSETTFTNSSVTKLIFLEGHACISYKSLVTVLGGFTPQKQASRSLHIFNTVTKQWLLGPHMHVGRGEFAWGLFGNRLYVAGGFGGKNVGCVRDVEYYDFDANEWKTVARMPVAVPVDAFFVLAGKMFVRGWIREGNLSRAFSYSPVSNVWEEEDWMLRSLRSVRPMTLNKFAVTGEKNNPPGDKNNLYMVEMEEIRVMVDDETEPVNLCISKLDFKTLEWVRFCSIVDMPTPYNCECPFGDRQVRFYGLKDRVLIVCHSHCDDHSDSDDSEEAELVSCVCPEVTKVSVRCPSMWSCAVINGE